MRLFLLAFVLPISTFWGWYLLSANDFGYAFFTRDMHDMVFQTYGNMLGMDPAAIPPLLVRACIVDTFIVLGIWAFRRRRDIAAWWNSRSKADPVMTARMQRATGSAGPVLPAE